MSDLIAKLRRCGIHDAADQIDRLTAENAALRKDAERLQWLADNPRGAQIVVDGKTQDCVFWGISSHTRATLYEAIDAAMGESHDPK